MAVGIDGDLEDTWLAAPEDLGKSWLDLFNSAHASPQCAHLARYLVKGHRVAVRSHDPTVELPPL